MVEQLKLLLDAARERARQADEAWSEVGETDPTDRWRVLTRSQDLVIRLEQAYELAILLGDNP